VSTAAASGKRTGSSPTHSVANRCSASRAFTAARASR
jgi:hypothetical protein